jgi:O-antigen ligase
VIWHLAPLILVLAVLPLGVAGQNIGGGIAGGLLLYKILKNGARFSQLKPFLVPFISSTLVILLCLLATVINAKNQDSELPRFVLGHIFWLTFPVAAKLAYEELSKEQWHRLFTVFVLITSLLGLIAVSQWLFGWKIVGVSPVAGSTRAQGLYSHPLTFAYVGMIIFPIAAAYFVRFPKTPASWLMFLASSAVVWFSHSRTVQIVALAVLVFDVAYFAKAQAKKIMFVGFAAIAALTVFTDNDVKQKFYNTFHGGHGVHSDYAFDRLAFWQVNWNMFKERPMLGHGVGIGSEYRRPYYEDIGLGDFIKQYEAHNTFLQLAVSGGGICLVAFLLWLTYHLMMALRLATFEGKVIFQTFMAFSVASFTQNSFQDSEVRYTLTVLCAALWLCCGAKSNLQSQDLKQLD